MSRINLNGKNIELYYNTKAMLDIDKRCGNLENLGEWLADGSRAKIIEKYACIICDLANGGVYKHNCEVELGLKDGEKQKFYTDDFFLCLISPNKIMTYNKDVFDAINEGLEFEIPENIQSGETDLDLAEVESEKN